MPIRGEMLIGGAAVRGAGGRFQAIDAGSGEAMAPDFAGADADQLAQACELADRAFDSYRETPPQARAAFLEAIGRHILAAGDELIERCMAETGLPRARIEGERGRTVNQLRLFADVVRDGAFLDVRIDPSMPSRQPLPRPDLRLRHVPLGPVAVFGASNFPLAFSVAGGDTVSALAAGCPVIAKAHPAHPGTSEIVGQAIQAAARDCAMPEGTFSLLFIDGHELGQALVADHRIKAVGFTGSRRGGMALMQVAASRPEPIPVYAEMSSINPVLLFPHALDARGADIAKSFVASLTLGAGQFCTNPGLVLAVDGPALDAFIGEAARAVEASEAATMLTPGILEAYASRIETVSRHPRVRAEARGKTGTRLQCQSGIFSTSAEHLLRHPELQEEIFGAASLVVRCPDLASVRQVLASLEGQLTAALHLDAADHAAAASLLPLLEKKVGRILVNGFGTGVEVGHAMVHGGPFPATSDGRSTSVGSLAIARFLRPVCYQDVPDALLPPALQDANPLRVPRRTDGGPPAR